MGIHFGHGAGVSFSRTKTGVETKAAFDTPSKGQRKTALSPDAPFGAWVEALPFLVKNPQTRVQVARLSKGRNLTLTRQSKLSSLITIFLS